ncbi:MAG: hypothetical protein LPK03_04995 [Pontibacter sp.]|nr:hypothetical protein [Pontibacter sp.]
MNLTLNKQVAQLLTCAAFTLMLFTAGACQSTASEENPANAVVEEQAADTAAVATAARPAPEFYAIPEDMMKKRVWICEDGAADIFHVKHDCPVLIQCKGKGSFRNLLLPKAIEEYGRYNCQVCSKEYDIIFDEEAVRDIGR